MAQPSTFFGIAPQSPTLSARLREMADFLAAPGAGRLTEEQRALTLGIVRRLVGDAAVQLDIGADPAAIWRDWSRDGVPGAERLSAPCFARAEEHRWRSQSQTAEVLAPEISDDDLADADQGTIRDAAIEDPVAAAVDQAHLALKIADRRRFDGFGNPCLAIADLETDLYRALLLDIAAWVLVQADGSPALASTLGEAVRKALAAQNSDTGMDAAAGRYADAGATATDAARRRDWPAIIALAARAYATRYDQMALLILTSASAQISSILEPLAIDSGAMASIEASLAAMTNRAVDSDFQNTGQQDLAANLRARAANFGRGKDDAR